MIAKVEDKTAAQQLHWNTRIELASRCLIFFVTFCILMMSYFVGAGCAKIYNQFHYVIGEQGNSTFKFYYALFGGLSFLLAMTFTILLAFPYLFMKRPGRIKGYIIITTVLTSVYVIACIATMASFQGIYGYTNSYISASYYVIIIGFAIILISKLLLWREVKKQWKMRKTFEYLNEEVHFTNATADQESLIEERNLLIKDAVESEDLDQHVIDNVNSIKGNVIKKKHLSRIWQRKAKIKEAKNK